MTIPEASSTYGSLHERIVLMLSHVIHRMVSLVGSANSVQKTMRKRTTALLKSYGVAVDAPLTCKLLNTPPLLMPKMRLVWSTSSAACTEVKAKTSKPSPSSKYNQAPDSLPSAS